jgi:tetratricopeptide (TPR) repeat protein
VGLEAGFYVLYNFGTANIGHADGLVNFIKDLLQDGIKVLVAVDNAHEERISPIFYVTDKLFSSQLTGNLKLILTARLPEFDLFVKDRLYKVSEGIRKSIIRLTCDPNFKYPLPYFTKEEIKEFIRLYSDITDKDQSDKKCQEIYDYTMGYPIMVKFSLFSQGLSHDVRERHDRYLKSPLQMKAMLICSLLDIASLKITNFILEKCRVLKGAYYIQGATLYQSSEGTWKTIHARWDEEFLSMLYNEENKAILIDRIEFLQDAIDSIFNLGDETITDSVIRNLYDLCTKGSLPVDIVDKVVIIPEYLSKDRKRDLCGHVRGRAYINKKRYNEAIAAYDKALEIDPCHVITLCNKGVMLGAVGKHDEALRCYDKALEIDPKKESALVSKGSTLKRLKRYDEAIRCYDKALELDPKNTDPLVLVEKGTSLLNLGKYDGAIKCFDTALEIDPKNVGALINKGAALLQLKKFEEAIRCYDKVLEIDPKNMGALFSKWVSKGSSLYQLGMYSEAVRCLNKASGIAATVELDKEKLRQRITKE